VATAAWQLLKPSQSGAVGLVRACVRLLADPSIYLCVSVYVSVGTLDQLAQS